MLLAFLALTAIAIARSRNLLATAMPLLPTQPVESVPYTVPHVVTQLQLLLWSALAFGGLNWYHRYPPELRSTNLDFGWVYRRAAPAVVQQCTRVIVAVHGAVVSTTYDRSWEPSNASTATTARRASSRKPGPPAAWRSGSSSSSASSCCSSSSRRALERTSVRDDAGSHTQRLRATFSMAFWAALIVVSTWALVWARETKAAS